ncbi:MAG TPA: response regulator transcription factor [Allosphingosinicella sp.]|jgi:two-component system nitrate/nitrite response regulator NarP|nr:response regulator transcription factor [Allosphingosinicella sp.]
MTRIFLADDDPLTREGVKLLLSRSNYEVVGEAENGAATLELIPAARPDLLLLDFDMPERSGFEVLRTLRERGDKRPVILLTGRMSDERVYQALQIGLNGLVIKASAMQQLLTCLDAVVAGRRWIDHDILQRAMDFSLSAQDGSAEAGPLAALSTRERSVASLIVRGLKNRDIAAELGIGEGTVKVHLHNIFEKLGVANRTELALLAAKAEAAAD